MSPSISGVFIVVLWKLIEASCWNMLLVMSSAPLIRSSYVGTNKLGDTLMIQRKAVKVAVLYVTDSRALCYFEGKISSKLDYT